MDLEVQDRYGVRFLTYYFDHERQTAFCLAQGPRAFARLRRTASFRIEPALYEFPKSFEVREGPMREPVREEDNVVGIVRNPREDIRDHEARTLGETIE